MMVRVVSILMTSALMIGLSGCVAGTSAEAVRESVARPDDPIAAYNAGTRLLSDGEHGLASEMLRRAATLADDPRTARYNLGVAYFLQADYVRAAAAFRAILEVDPTDQDARHNYELSLSLIENALPETQQQLTEPQEGETDPTVTPTPQPGGFDGPTPTPPRAEFEPDLTQTPVGGAGDFAMANQTATPVPREVGGLTVSDAMRLLDGQNTRSIAPFSPSFGTAEGVNTENDW